MFSDFSSLRFDVVDFVAAVVVAAVTESVCEWYWFWLAPFCFMVLFVFRLWWWHKNGSGADLRTTLVSQYQKITQKRERLRTIFPPFVCELLPSTLAYADLSG